MYCIFDSFVFVFIECGGSVFLCAISIMVVCEFFLFDNFLFGNVVLLFIFIMYNVIFIYF